MVVKRTLGLLFLGAWLLGTGVSNASDTYSDSPGTWSGPLTGASASGHCTVECQNPTRGNNVRFHASGLAPNVTYTAWWVDEDGTERPLGMHKMLLRANERGWLDFQTRLPQCPSGESIKIIVRTEGKGKSEQVLSGTASSQ